MPSQIWSASRRKAHAIKMKEIANKKKLKIEKAVVNKANCLTPDVSAGYAQQAEDSRRNAEFQFRRGLVTAMECILRELR